MCVCACVFMFCPWRFLPLVLGLEEVSAAALVRFFRRLVGRSSMEMGFAGCGLGELLLPAKPLLESMGAQVRTSCQVRGFLGGWVFNQTSLGNHSGSNERERERSTIPGLVSICFYGEDSDADTSCATGHDLVILH